MYLHLNNINSLQKNKESRTNISKTFNKNNFNNNNKIKKKLILIQLIKTYKKLKVIIIQKVMNNVYQIKINKMKE